MSQVPKSTLSKEELLAFLESYRNVIEFNTHLMEEIKTISVLAKSVNDDLGEYRHKLDIVSKDIFFKFEAIVGMLRSMESNFAENKHALEDLKKVRELADDIFQMSEKLQVNMCNDHHTILTNVRIGWIAIATFFGTAIGGLITLIITYYKEVSMLKKLLDHFGIK